MKPRQLYPDLVDTAPETVVVDGVTFTADAAMTGSQSMALSPSAFSLRIHQGENRRRRRSEVAKFTIEGQPLLRRQLLKQRQKRDRGKMDVELNRLRRRKAAEK